MKLSGFILLAIILILSHASISTAQSYTAQQSYQNAPLQPVFPANIESSDKNASKDVSEGQIETVSDGYNTYDLQQQISFSAYQTQILLAIAILVFALILCILMAYIVTRKGIEWDPTSVIRIFGLTFVITTGMYLITAGYSSERIAPMLSLLASIAGYLLGATKSRNEQQTDNSKE